MKPNTLIIRLADVGGSKTFACLPLVEGYIVTKDAYEFNVFDGDTYNLLGFDDMVFAVSSDGGQSSLELVRMKVYAEDGVSAVVCHEQPQQVALMAKYIFDNWDAKVAEGKE